MAFHASAAVDTGCTKNIINERLVMQHKLEMFTNEGTLLAAANGSHMTVTGTTALTAKANGITRLIHILMSAAITEDMLVSCNNLIRLEIIPRHFFNVRVQNCRSIKEFKEKRRPQP